MILDSVFCVGLMLVSFLGQTVVLPALGVTSVSPNLILASVASIAFLCGPYVGMATGAVTGCIVDIFYSPGVGMVAMPLAAIGYYVGMRNNRFRSENIVIAPIMAALGQIVCDLFSLLLLYFTRNEAAVTGAVILRSLLTALMTGAAALPVYLLCYRFFTRGNRRKESGRMLMVG